MSFSLLATMYLMESESYSDEFQDRQFFINRIQVLGKVIGYSLSNSQRRVNGIFQNGIPTQMIYLKDSNLPSINGTLSGIVLGVSDDFPERAVIVHDTGHIGNIKRGVKGRISVVIDDVGGKMQRTIDITDIAMIE